MIANAEPAVWFLFNSFCFPPGPFSRTIPKSGLIFFWGGGASASDKSVSATLGLGRLNAQVSRTENRPAAGRGRVRGLSIGAWLPEGK